MPTVAESRKQTVQAYARHEGDTGSPEVQIALLTERIQAISEHLRGHGRDHHTRRGLVLMVGKRNRLLRYLARIDREKYLGVIGRLGLRK